MRIIDHFDNAVTLYPTNTAFRNVGGDGAELSYAEAYPLTAGFADAIRGNGFGAGAHVGILAPNCTEAFIALLGLFRAQCVWLPINPRNTVAVNADLLGRFDGELLLFHSSFAQQAAQLQAECSGIRSIVCIDGDCGTGTSLERWQEGQQGAFQQQPSSLDDLFAIFPTGGTTGQSKGVMLTHRNIHNMFFAAEL